MDPRAAALAAGAALLVQQTAVDAWVRPGEGRPLPELMAGALAALRLTAGPYGVRGRRRSRGLSARPGHPRTTPEISSHCRRSRSCRSTSRAWGWSLAGARS